MGTLKTTTPQAVSRKLSSLGFEKAYAGDDYGFIVYKDEASIGWGCEITVSNFTVDNGHRSTIAEELVAAGYAVDIVVDNVLTQGRVLTSVIVLGKVAA